MWSSYAIPWSDPFVTFMLNLITMIGAPSASVRRPGCVIFILPVFWHGKIIISMKSFHISFYANNRNLMWAALFSISVNKFWAKIL